MSDDPKETHVCQPPCAEELLTAEREAHQATRAKAELLETMGRHDEEERTKMVDAVYDLRAELETTKAELENAKRVTRSALEMVRPAFEHLRLCTDRSRETQAVALLRERDTITEVAADAGPSDCDLCNVCGGDAEDCDVDAECWGARVRAFLSALPAVPVAAPERCGVCASHHPGQPCNAECPCDTSGVTDPEDVASAGPVVAPPETKETGR